MKPISVVPPLFLLQFFSSTNFASALTPASITNDVATYGARETVVKLTKAPPSRDWNFVMQHAEQGESRWLAVAKQLANGTDAGTSEDLQIALAIALPKNPAGVLRLADTQSFLTIEDLCSAPFIEASERYIKHYLIQARRALEKTSDRAVENKRRKCLARIDSTISETFSRPAR